MQDHGAISQADDFDGIDRASAKGRRCHVLLPLPLAGPYDYAAPEAEEVAPGDFVRVPLGRRVVAGVVWGKGAADADNAVADERLRPIIARLPVPPMVPVTRRFIDWLAQYYCSYPGAVLRMAMSVPSALEPPRPIIGYALDGQPPERMTAARGRVIEALAARGEMSRSALLKEAQVGAGVTSGLVRAGTLREIAISAEPRIAKPDWRRSGIELNDEQDAAAAALRDKVSQAAYSVTLLDGVTGAGKTEVYFEAVAAALADDRQALVLLPEIALTAQWLSRFERRFGIPPVAWHSDLGAAERRRNWRAIALGEARVVVGARSALFLPFAELGLVVVDEEHDGAFKQDEGVSYHARDMAVVRGLLGEHAVILVSATPSIETMNNINNGRYGSLHLTERVGSAVLPEVSAIDLREEPPPRGRWLSPRLEEAVTETLQEGGQALLFLNRRGYAPLTLCRTCGYRLQCPHCSAWLVEHRFRGRLQCHHCGYGLTLPEKCPDCEDSGSFAACGPGVERLMEEVAAVFPEARATVASSDTIHGPAAAAALVEMIANREVDLVIGTQIVAKGHHFPYLTLVGVIDADLGLNGGDLRAAERTFQLLHQVAGRAGRGHTPGRVLLQSYQPEHPVMQALVAGDRARFLEEETAARERDGWPPFGRLAALVVSGPDEAQVQKTAADFFKQGPRGDDILVLGPAPAPLSLLRGRYRYRLLLKVPRNVDASALTRQWLSLVEVPAQVRVSVDIDPYNFF
jgi:primosomal protein N' (replication factor Y)